MAGPEQDLENYSGEGLAGVRYSCLQGLLLKSALAFGSCLVIPYGKTGLICTRWLHTTQLTTAGTLDFSYPETLMCT